LNETGRKKVEKCELEMPICARGCEGNDGNKILSDYFGSMVYEPHYMP